MQNLHTWNRKASQKHANKVYSLANNFAPREEWFSLGAQLVRMGPIVIIG